MLRSTYEEENLLAAIPDDIKEILESKFQEEFSDPIQTELEEAGEEAQKMQNTIDELTEACLVYAVEKYIGDMKPKQFTVSAYELSKECPALADCHLVFQQEDYYLNHNVYFVKESKGKFTFTPEES